MIYLTVIWTLVKKFWLPVVVLAAAIAVGLYLIEVGEDRAEERQATLDAKAKVQTANEQAAKAIALANEFSKAHAAYVAATERTHAIEMAEAQSRTVIHAITQETLREVTTRIPADTPPLPFAWRVLHDAAARGVRPAEATASAPRGADAAPVSAQDAAVTVIENYGTYHELASRLKALQQWVGEVCR